MMKKILLSCLLLSTILFANAQESLTLKKDGVIINPNTGLKYILDEDSTENNLECQTALENTTDYFFNADETQIISAENCYLYILEGENETPVVTTNTGSNETGQNQTGDSEQTEEPGPVAPVPQKADKDTYEHDDNKSEIENAVAWMYENGLTKFPTVGAYQVSGDFTREQGAKFFVEAARILNFESDATYNCEFSDIEEAHKGLSGFVIESCTEGMFKGDQGKFLPKEPFSLAQTLTVVIKVFQNGQPSQPSDPWRKVFYDKSNSLGLTNGLAISEDTIYNTTSRGEIAILLYRLRNLMRDTGNVLVNEEEKVDTEVIVNNAGLGSQNLSFDNEPEFLSAFGWMKDLGMITEENTTDYQPLNFLERQDAARYLAIFHQTFFDQTGDGIPDKCFHEDLGNARQENVPFILYLCQESIMKGADGNFFPDWNITKAQLIAGLINILDIELSKDEEYLFRREPYFNEAVMLGLVEPSDKISFEKEITKYETALLLYRFSVRYKLLQDLNNANSNVNDVFTVFDDTQEEELDSETEKKIAINTNKLFDEEGRIGIIELLNGKKYALQKEKSINIFTNSTNRFGTLYTLDSDESAGSINLLLNTNSRLIVEGTVRMDDGEVYEIRPSDFTTAYYIMKRIHHADQTD